MDDKQIAEQNEFIGAFFFRSVSLGGRLCKTRVFMHGGFLHIEQTILMPDPPPAGEGWLIMKRYKNKSLGVKWMMIKHESMATIMQGCNKVFKNKDKNNDEHQKAL